MIKTAQCMTINAPPVAFNGTQLNSDLLLEVAFVQFKQTPLSELITIRDRPRSD